MKWIKAHVFMIVCILVVGGSLALWFFYFSGSMRDDLQHQMEERANQDDTISTLMQPDLTIPGVNGDLPRPITPQMVKAKQDAQDQMAQYATKITALAAEENKKNRLNGNDIPLLGTTPKPGLLPVTNRDVGDPWDFKNAYLHLFDVWYSELVFGSPTQPPTPGSINGFIIPQDKGIVLTGFPPQSTDVGDAWAYQKKRLEETNTHRNATGQIISGHMDPNLTGKYAEDAFTRAYVTAWDSQYKMYGSKSMFQIRPWAFGDNAPDEKSIFEAFVDVWIQQDIVNAILAINKDSDNVFKSPIKYVEQINIGAAAAASQTISSPFSVSTGNSPQQVSTGEIFLDMGSTTGAGAGPAFAPPAGMGAAPAGPTALDFSRSMTGRVGSSNFDVTQFMIVLHIEPNKLNDFISELYRMNNGYTILNIKIDSVNPFDAAGNGFIYGRVPVVRVQILGEAMFFRDWTSKIMPNNVRAALVPPMDLYVPPTAAGAAAAAPPAGAGAPPPPR